MVAYILQQQQMKVTSVYGYNVLDLYLQIAVNFLNLEYHHKV